jgi:hypothetical protein
VTLYSIRQPFGGDALTAFLAAAEETARAKLDCYRNTFPRQIGQSAEISTVNAAGRFEPKQGKDSPLRLIAIPSPAGIVPQLVLHVKQLLLHLELRSAVPYACTGETARVNLFVARIASPEQYHQRCGRT